VMVLVISGFSVFQFSCGIELSIWTSDNSGGTSAVKEPAHFEVSKSLSQVTRCQGRSQHFILGAQKLSARGLRRSQDFLWGALF